MKSESTKAIFSMILAALSFAVMSAAVKSASAFFSPGALVWVRSTAGAVLIFFLILSQRASFAGKNRLLLFLRGVSGFIALLLSFYVMRELDLGLAILLVQTSPIFASLLSHFFLGEKLKAGGYAAILIAFTGVTFLAGPRLSVNALAIAAGLTAGLFAAVAYILVRQTRNEPSGLTVIFYFTVISALGSSYWMPEYTLLSDHWQILLILVLTSVIGQILLTQSLRLTSASLVLPFGYLTPVCGSVFDRYIWGADLTATDITGGFLVIAAGIYLYRLRKSAIKI